MKKALILLTVSLLSLSAFAQHWCGTNLLLEEQIKKDPSFKAVVEAAWEVGDQGTSVVNQSGSRAIDIIPVVVHVVHDNGIGNISYAQVEDAIKVLNRDFRRINADTGATRTMFKPFAADSEIEFRLAKKDPNGDCTNGVVRVNNRNYTYDANNTVKSISYWPSNKYLNIWVINSIQNFSGGSGSVLGYAQFPGAGSWSTYGIVIRHDQFGTIGTSNADGRTLTHEVGHCLNLLHTFQSGCGNNCNNSGDRVCDTPPAYQATYGCSSTQNTCSNDAVGSTAYNSNVVDQIENYMSYDNCQNMFTLGQKSRMKTVLNQFNQLKNLVSASNHVATGVNISTPVLCKAEFQANKTVICAGNTIEFEDLSFDGVTSRSWTFNGGSPASSTQSSPSIQYNSPGFYSVKLDAGNGTNNVQETKTNYILVLPAPGADAPLQESFEFSGDLESKHWFPKNNVLGVGWNLDSANAATGSKCLKVNNWGFNNSKTEIVSPSYDLRNLSSAGMSFKWAFARRNPSNADQLLIEVSGDCGNNWEILENLIGPALSTRLNKNSSYDVVDANDWKTKSVAIPDSLKSGSSRIRFRFIGRGGNNLYLDDINIGGSLKATPLLKAPYSGATGLGALGAPVELDWKAAAPSDMYELAYDTSASFNSGVKQTVTKNYIGASSGDVDTKHDALNLIPNAKYYWKVRTKKAAVYSAWSETWWFTVDKTSSVFNPIQKLKNIQLFPNPSQERANLILDLTEGEKVAVSATDILGKQTRKVFEGFLGGGSQRIVLETAGWSKGIYLVQIQVGESFIVQKLIVQ